MLRFLVAADSSASDVFEHSSVNFTRKMTFFEIIGYLVVAGLSLRFVYNACCFVYTSFIGKLLGCAIDVRKYGPWAGKLFILL